MSSGALVTDEIVVNIIRKRIQEPDCKMGFVLDGFPRTLPQAQAVDEMLRANGECVNSVIELHVPNSVLEKRITGRWIHKKSGRSYHVQNKPPKSFLEGTSAAPTFGEENGIVRASVRASMRAWITVLEASG